MKIIKFIICGFALLSVSLGRAAELVYLDDTGVIRWNSDHSEVALFGANYNLPSACDYRAAGYLNSDKKKLVEHDMAHFARMGWDALRFSFWGDWENSDKEGNLIANEHLDLMDYTIAEARKRGVYILFTPISTYASWFPEAEKTDQSIGFSKYYRRDELGTNPAAIAAQVNYLKQLLNHVNPYTGLALKDEPSILFVEMVNEPWHHPENFGGAVDYINTLVDAVRSTGCQKILFHNLSQDMRMVSAIKTSRAQGVTFAWYPTGLNAGHALTDNHLRAVDDYPTMLRADLEHVPKIVYEFDSADMTSGYMYPAIIRAFRGVGAQFATMFSYDMLDTAPYNLGWQTHFLNLVYSPKKAVSAIIASQAMRVIPRYAHFGDYPENRAFGPFRVNYEEDLSEMNTDDTFLYANDTATKPKEVSHLTKIVGFGSSPVVNYEGRGAYFIDKLSAGAWRLEVYPDAILVQDPFSQRLNYKTISSRLIAHEWPMTIRLPDLGNDFKVTPLNDGNGFRSEAQGGTFVIRPGVYILSRDGKFDPASAPPQIGHVGLKDFVCPATPKLPIQIISEVREDYVTDQVAKFTAQIVSEKFPDVVKLFIRPSGSTEFKDYPMSRTAGYLYTASLDPGVVHGGVFEYYITAADVSSTVRYPAKDDTYEKAQMVAAETPLMLFDPAKDIPALVYTRIGDTVRHGIFKALPAEGDAPAAFRLMFPVSMDRTLDDYTASLAIKDRVQDRNANLGSAKSVHIKARSETEGQIAYVTLVEDDGTSWSTAVTLSSKWTDEQITLDKFHIAQGVKLPLAYPERWDYWVAPAKGRGGDGDHVKISSVEGIQLSLRPSPKPGAATTDATVPDTSIDVASIALEFN